MDSTLSFGHRDAISHFQLAADIVSNVIILSITDDDIAKTARQIVLENNFPISSAHKSSIDSGDK
jgi:hypothetical protein